MTKIELEVHDDALAAINKIKNLNDTGIELVIPEGSVLFDNIISLKLISQFAEKTQKAVQFTTMDDTGISLIAMLEEPAGTAINEFKKEYESEIVSGKTKGSGFKITALPKIRLPRVMKKAALLPLILIAILIGAIFFISKKPEAYSTITLKALPFTRSNTIKVINGGATDPEKLELKGLTIITNVEVTDEVPTTGEKTVGKKAEGEAIIYNKTNEEIKLKEGSKLNFDEKDFVYILDDDVVIPASVEQLEPAGIVFGEATVDITAEDIGDKYNIDKGEDLEVSGYKSSEMTAKTKSDMEGGESKIVKVVSEDDRTSLQKKAADAAKIKAAEELKYKLGKTQRLIEGSVTTRVTKETYSAEPEDEAEKLMITIYAEASGLTYMDADLNSLLDKVLESIIPENKMLSEKQRETSVTPMGNSSSSVLNSEEADLQITLKTFTVSKIDKEQLKLNLAGKSISEAEKILESAGEISTYSIKIEPTIPFFKNVPKDTNRINLEIENE